MFKKTLPILLVILILAISAIYYFSGLGSKKVDPWLAIPENAALIIETDKPGKLFNKLNDNNEVWASFLSNSAVRSFQTELSRLDSLQIAHKTDLIRNHSIYLSIHPIKENTEPEILVILPLAENEGFDHLNRVLKDLYTITQTDGLNDFYTITNIATNNTFYLSVRDGLVIASSSKSLVNQSVNQLLSKNHKHKTDQHLAKLRSVAGTKVDARIFINYLETGALLSRFGNDTYSEQIRWLNQFALWTEVDVMFKKDELLMSGFTIVDSSGSSFLHSFIGQKPVKHSAYNILPFNTNLLLSVGFSDFNSYPFASDISKISSELNFDFNKVLKLIDGEIALANNATKTKSINRQSWFLIRTSDKTKILSYLRQISKNTKGKTATKYSGYRINHINYKALIPKIFGQTYSAIQDNWFTQIGDYIVFGNSKETLINFIRIYETGKTLDLNENFKSFSDNLSGSSNILLFIKPRDFSGKAAKFVNPRTLQFLKKNEKTIRNIEGIAFQFSAEKEMFFTSFYLKNNKNYKDENLALWKTQLDDDAAGKPFLVKDHKTENYNVVVFDKSANMYLVSTDGRILWKKRIDALPESPIFEVDYYKNRKIQYLFNSPDFIYLIDKNGDNVEGYPKKINPSATNGLSLFDYNNKRDYRLVLAQSDKKVYNYTLPGKQVKGWSKPKTQNIVIEPVERLVANKKDYFIITDVDSRISIVNRKGNQRIKLKQDPEKAKHSTFYINKTNSKGIIITTNKKGKLVYISASGNLQFTDFGDFSSSHFFLYEDFNADGSKDFIYVDGDQLAVFDRFKNVLFSYQFESAISIKPEFFHLGSKQRVLGIVADQEKTVYLFDNKGNTLINKGLVGETPFTVGSLENNKELNLVTSAGSTLYNYRID